jgi:SSS family solute:Na+ symporter
MTEPKPDSQLFGLVRGCTELPSEGHLSIIKRPVFWAVIILVVFAALNLIFW